MDLLLFLLPSLLVAAAYLAPTTESGAESAKLPAFGAFSGCKR